MSKCFTQKRRSSRRRKKNKNRKTRGGGGDEKRVVKAEGIIQKIHAHGIDIPPSEKRSNVPALLTTNQNELKFLSKVHDKIKQEDKKYKKRTPDLLKLPVLEDALNKRQQSWFPFFYKPKKSDLNHLYANPRENPNYHLGPGN
jgi:hypothetical protein